MCDLIIHSVCVILSPTDTHLRLPEDGIFVRPPQEEQLVLCVSAPCGQMLHKTFVILECSLCNKKKKNRKEVLFLY